MTPQEIARALSRLPVGHVFAEAAHDNHGHAYEVRMVADRDVRAGRDPQPVVDVVGAPGRWYIASLLGCDPFAPSPYSAVAGIPESVALDAGQNWIWINAGDVLRAEGARIRARDRWRAAWRRCRDHHGTLCAMWLDAGSVEVAGAHARISVRAAERASDGRPQPAQLAVTVTMDGEQAVGLSEYLEAAIENDPEAAPFWAGIRDLVCAAMATDPEAT